MICENCEQLSAQTVQRLFELIKKIGVPTIFAETTINPALIKTFAQEAASEISTKSTLLWFNWCKGKWKRFLHQNSRGEYPQHYKSIGEKYLLFQPKK